MGERIAQAVLVALVAVTALAPIARAEPFDDERCGYQPDVVVPNARRNQLRFDWNDDVHETRVRFKSRTCADLNGTLYAPLTLPKKPVPGVLVFPPSGGVADESQVAYIARTLASNGYIAMTADPQGVGDSGLLSHPVCNTEPGYSTPSPCPGIPFQQTDSWMDMARSSLDFFLSPSNPLRPKIDAGAIGAVGHSLGARVSSYLQDPRFDGAGVRRIHAVVGLDNISSNYYGDPSAGGGDTPVNDLIVGQYPTGDEPIDIAVPGLGLASDGTNADPDFKKYAFERWREAGVPSGMLVFEGVAHDDFSQGASSDEATLHRFAYYTLAWFDRWLRDDTSAIDRLLTRDVLGTDATALLSDTQHSAWYLPGAMECDDWRTGC
jgi:hypothetical protein